MRTFENIPCDNSWKALATNADFQEKLKHVEYYVDSLNYYPMQNEVFRFMRQDLHQIKCIILGMDPYASWYKNSNGEILPEANGRSFEPRSVDSWSQKFKQSSLRNMLKTVYYNKTGQLKSLEEIRKEIEDGKFQISQPHQWFDNLEKQGVSFLNSSLTVSPGLPSSHAKLWEEPMNDIIKYIDRNNKEAKWMLFGNAAQERVEKVLGKNDENQYRCCHPRLPQFVTENIFEKVPEIKWDC